MTDETFKNYILDQLEELAGLHCRGMFGGFGLYLGPRFFGIVASSRLYFKTNPDTRSRYIDEGMGPFQPSEKQTLKNYYEVPVEVLERPTELLSWAREAAAVT